MAQLNQRGQQADGSDEARAHHGHQSDLQLAKRMFDSN
jgi:hypothetical protein